jgi:hypothetical protein
MRTFKLDGLVGRIDSDNFISWATIRCHLDSLGDCPLKTAALKAK